MKNKLAVDIEGLKNNLKAMGIKRPYESHILREVYIMLSLECNLRCRICAWWGIKGPCRKQDFLKRYCSSLTWKELKGFADDIIKFNPAIVTFSGGEPLLHEEWSCLAKYFHKKGMKVSLTTNGTLLLKNFNKIKESVDEINLSLGGPPSILSRIRENPVSHFRPIMKGLQKITQLKRKNNNRPFLRILYTISDLSYGHMEELIKFMKRHDIAIDHYKFQHLMFIDAETLKEQKKVFSKEFNIDDLSLWQGYTYNPVKLDFRRFQKEIETVKEYDNTSFSPDLSGKDLRDYYQNNKGALRYARYCTAPWHQINVMPDGRIYTCHDYFIGNIKDNSFTAIWNGNRAKKLRKYLTNKLFPACKGCFYHYCDRVK